MSKRAMGDHVRLILVGCVKRKAYCDRRFRLVAFRSKFALFDVSRRKNVTIEQRSYLSESIHYLLPVVQSRSRDI